MNQRRLKITQGPVECVAAEFGEGENKGLVALWVKMAEPHLSKADADLVTEAFAVCNRLDMTPLEMEQRIKELESSPADPRLAAAGEMEKALQAAELFEAKLILEWADFWDVAPQALIDALMGAQAKRNAALAKYAEASR
jgi:hypothetical protein